MKRFFLCSIFPLIVIVFLFSTCAPESGSGDGTIHPLGVWWWDTYLIQDARYYDFAVKNHVDEIYLARSERDIADFGPEIEAFIEKARRKGIKVYLLLGFTYITYDNPGLRDALRSYKDYQSRVPANRRYDGLHLDIEFHADEAAWSVEANRNKMLAEYLALIVRLRSEMPDTPMDIDIPFWFDQDVEFKGERRPLYQSLIDTADRVFVMSYRDTAEAMFETAKEEVAYARQKNKPIMLSAETGKDAELDQVSYFEEGGPYLYEQLKLLNGMLNYPKAGVSIHHMKTWYDLRD